jgi:hypothetical protein
MSNVIPGVPNSPAGWPTIEESFDEDTMSRRFDMTPKGLSLERALAVACPSGMPMSKRNANDLVDKFPISLAMSSLTDKVHDISLQGFLLQGGFSKQFFRMFSSIGELTIHTIFSKSEVDSKGIVVPIFMWVPVREVDPMSKNGKADFGRKSGEVKGGQAGNTHF